MDPFRDAIATVNADGKVVGYLATNVEVMWEGAGGILWWTRWVKPRECIEWMLTRTDITASLPQWTDGWDFDGDTGVLEDLERGQFEFPDYAFDGSWNQRDVTVYDLIWLVGEERDSAWRAYGYGDASA
jgi:hypothetical protein